MSATRNLAMVIFAITLMAVLSRPVLAKPAPFFEQRKKIHCIAHDPNKHRSQTVATLMAIAEDKEKHVYLRYFAVMELGKLKAVEVKDRLEALAERLDWSDQTRQLRTQAYLSYWMVTVASQPAEQHQIELLRQALKKGVTIGAVQDWAADELSNRGVADALPEIVKSIKGRMPGKWGDERIWFCKTRIELLAERPSRQEALIEALGMKDITQYQALKQWAIEELGKLDTPESRQALIGFAIELQTTYHDAMGKRGHRKGDQESTHASSFYHAIIKRLRCNGMSLSDMESAGLKPRKLFFTSGGPAFNESQCCSCP